MRINRKHSHNGFRRDNRWSGCLLWMITLCLSGLMIFFGRDRIQHWLLQRLSPPIEIGTVNDARNAFFSGDLNNSINYAQNIYENEPDNIAALEILARSLIYHSYADINQDADRVLALTLTTEAVERTPYNMRLLGIHAFALQANGLTEDAGRVALRVIRNDEESITARLALSLSYAGQGIFEAALRDAERAVEIATTSQPDWRADAYRVLALAQSDSGHYADAASAVETAISYNRRLVPLHFERALYAQQIGDMDTATAYYFNVIAFDENNTKARFRLCEVSSLLGERDAAIDWCMQVTELTPGWAEGWYWLGREFYLNGNWENTQSALNRCSTLEIAQSVPIEERRFECWYIQGQAAEVLGDCDSLIALYQEYQQMADSATLTQRWVYPDDMPPICATPTQFPGG